MSEKIRVQDQKRLIPMKVLVARRLIKLLANLLKVGCYAFHFIAPKKRFRIPAHSAPLSKHLDGQKIPATLWQTNFTDLVTLPVYLNYLFNRLMAPGYEYRFMITDDRAKFIRENYPAEIFEAYSRLNIGAAQADFWRILVLEKFGGVYMDIDAHFIWPARQLIHGDADEIFLKIKTGELSNYFIASRPNSPYLQALIKQITLNIQKESSANVYDLTGPGVFNKVLGGSEVTTVYYLGVCNQGNFTNEYFQYIDKPQGKWTKEQQVNSIVSKSR
jgi:mannosyltransferase OCH1-like enzyme